MPNYNYGHFLSRHAQAKRQVARRATRPKVIRNLEALALQKEAFKAQLRKQKARALASRRGARLAALGATMDYRKARAALLTPEEAALSIPELISAPTYPTTGTSAAPPAAMIEAQRDPYYSEPVYQAAPVMYASPYEEPYYEPAYAEADAYDEMWTEPDMFDDGMGSWFSDGVTKIFGKDAAKAGQSMVDMGMQTAAQFIPGGEAMLRLTNKLRKYGARPEKMSSEELALLAQTNPALAQRYAERKRIFKLQKQMKRKSRAALNAQYGAGADAAMVATANGLVIPADGKPLPPFTSDGQVVVSDPVTGQMRVIREQTASGIGKLLPLLLIGGLVAMKS